MIRPASTTPSLEVPFPSKFLAVTDGLPELVLEGQCSQVDIEKIVEGLKTQATPINALFLYRSFTKSINEAKLSQIFQNLSGLQNLSISSVVIAAETLLTLLDNALHLKKIRFDRIIIECRPSERLVLIERLCKAMSNISELEDFHISLGSHPTLADNGNVIPLLGGSADDNFGPLMQAISTTKTLKSVYLGSDKKIHRTTMDPNVLATITSLVDEFTLRNIGLGPVHYMCFDSPSLKLLNLIQVGLRNTGARILAQSLRNDRNKWSLKKLYLPGNEITDRGGVAIVDALRSTQSFRRQLEVLDLHDNKMGEATVSELSKLVGIKKSRLAFLDLSGNELGDSCGAALASMLPSTSLKHLVLFKCGLGVKSCQAIVASLSVDKSLASLNLYGNNISKECLVAFVECIKHRNSTLESLEVKFSPDDSKNSRSSTNKDLERELKFHLKLNRGFRGGNYLLKTASEYEFVTDAIAKAAAQDDPSFLFYFLSARPCLFAHSAQGENLSFKTGTKVACPVTIPFAGTIKLRAQTFCNPQA